MTTAVVNPVLVEARQKVQETVDFIRSRTTSTPEIALILGSGLGELADDVTDRVVIPYKDIPHFPISTAPAHAGNLVVGTLSGKRVILQQGRFHSYEGYNPKEITFPVRIFRALGVETLVVTAATGGLNKHFKAGDLMMITDHLNLTGTNPLNGPNDGELGPRFPVMFDAYNRDLRDTTEATALREGITLRQGVYAGINGPVFFTPAELRMLITLGADSIGMSTVFETIAAVHGGMKVLGLAAVTDMAIPDSGHHSGEAEILAIAAEMGPRFRRLVKAVLNEI
ncbi:MAG: purine-nucleoside phosphorylase [Candidatus Sericytochromatia bacterium]|nr:purine-nucleoside phosphorylase [Candidatus Sericytochromatia bacterium]